jgi:hypothetical protein
MRQSARVSIRGGLRLEIVARHPVQLMRPSGNARGRRAIAGICPHFLRAAAF